MKHIIAISILFIALTSCKQTDSSNENKISETIQNSNMTKVVLGDFSIQLPEGWSQEKADNSVRVTQFALLSDSQHKIAVFYFGEQDMKAENITRWKDQFTELESSEELGINHSSITAIKLVGTYKKKPFPMSRDFVETPNYGTLAAIIPSETGPYYFKISAPKDFILMHEADFIELLNSYSLNIK